MREVILAIYTWTAWFGSALAEREKNSFFGGLPRGRGTLIVYPTTNGETFSMTFHGEPVDV